MLKLLLAGLLVVGSLPSDAKTSRTYLKPKNISKRVDKKPKKVSISLGGTNHKSAKLNSNFSLGEVPVGETASITITFSFPNAGPSKAFPFTGTTGGGAGYSVADDGCNGKTLIDGQTCDITWEFSSLDSGVKSSSFVVHYLDTVPTAVPPIAVPQEIPLSFSIYAIPAPPEYEENPAPLNQQAACPGSIIQVDSLTLGEMVPIVGTDINLSYTSSNADEFVTSSPKAHRKSFFNPEGFSISGHHYFDRANLKFFDGAGSSRFAKYIEQDGEVLVASKDGDEIYHFDSSGRHLTTRNSLTGGILKTFSYASGKLVSITDSYSNTITLTRNGSGVLTSITAPRGQVTTIGTNGSGLITSIANPMNHVHSFTYKSGTELLATFTKPGGQVSTFTYDTDGKLTQDLGNGGNKWDFLLSLLVDQRTINKSFALSRTDTYYFWAEYGDNHRYVDYASGAWSDQIEKYNQGGTASYEEGLGFTEFTTLDERLGILYARPHMQYIVADDDGTERQQEIWYDRYVIGRGIYDFEYLSEWTYVKNRRVSIDSYTAADKKFQKTTNAYASSTKTIDQYGKLTSYQLGSDDV